MMRLAIVLLLLSGCASRLCHPQDGRCIEYRP